MIYVSLEDVQVALPDMNVYAWHLTYHPELERYRAVAWMKLPWGNNSQVAFEHYLPVADSKETLLRWFKEALEDAWTASSPKGLKKVERS